MTDFQFDEENQYRSTPRLAAPPSGILALLITWGLASTPEAAQKVLLYVAVGAFALAAAVFLFFGSSSQSEPPPEVYLPLPLDG